MEYYGSNYHSDWPLYAKTTLLYADEADSRVVDGYFGNVNTQKYSNLNFNYTVKLDSLGSAFNIKADYTSNKPGRENAADVRTLFLDGTLEKDSAYRNFTPSDDKIYTADAKYSKLWKNGMQFSGGGKITSSYMKNNALFQYMANGNWTDDDNQSYTYNYLENILAGYVNFNGTFLKTEFQAGLRMESTHTKGELITSDIVNKKTYPGWFPSVFLKKNTDSAQQNYLTFTFNRQIRRPSYWQLNPFVTFVDNYTTAEGNPYLQPQFSNNFEVGYTLQNKYSLSIGYHKYSNNIAQIMLPGANDLSMIYRQSNIEGFASWTAELVLPVKIAKFWETNNTISGWTSDYKMPDYRNRKTTFQFQSNQDISLPLDVKLSLSAFYITDMIQGNFNVKGYGGLDLGLQKSFLNKKLTANIAVNDLLYSQKTDLYINYQNYTSHSFQKQQTRTFSLTLRYNFSVGKKVSVKKMEKASQAEQSRL